ncbi:hypothetical protein [Nocardia farcinica]|uniref:hypothetical protein n=1 Tax=Nocardia farcinica TaxID=37329 RepID=UPI000DF8A58A|nr:hypothetical protein [Nocardia farcinica]SUE28619.1 Uncharacterised protein [Nocardia farcinica]
MRAPRNTVAALLAAAALAAVGTACDEAEKAVNKGGDTPCSEFTAQDADKKRTTVTKFLEEERGEAPADQNTLDLAIAAIDLMCSAQADPDTPIHQADLTGVLVPK